MTLTFSHILSLESLATHLNVSLNKILTMFSVPYNENLAVFAPRLNALVFFIFTVSNKEEKARLCLATLG